jgi:hypothetical protein
MIARSVLASNQIDVFRACRFNHCSHASRRRTAACRPVRTNAIRRGTLRRVLVGLGEGGRWHNALVFAVPPVTPQPDLEAAEVGAVDNMAKPSATNIQAPSKTIVWEAPKTEWFLDNTTDLNWAKDHGWYADKGSATYDSLWSSINQPAGGPTLDKAGYDYIFFGVNGGVDETVHGEDQHGGVIVTGNGMDTIWDGSKGDLILAGNGKDAAHGGAGNGIIYGENGANTLFGDSDNGTSSVAQGGFTFTPLASHHIDGDTALGEGKSVGPNNDQHHQDNQGSLSKDGYWLKQQQSRHGAVRV